MRAMGLWRFAPRFQTRIQPERAMAARSELMPPELQKKMVAAFERARAERLGAQIPEQGASQATDPWTRANTAAFLILESERRAIATRLCRRYRRPRDRYRDLVLVTKLLRLEYEHLAGRVGERAGPPAPPNGLPVGGDMPAEWARPWGSGPMVEIGTAFIFYRDQRDRLAKRLPTSTVKSAAAAAAQRRNGILSRFEGAMGEWRPELEHGGGTAAGSRKRQAKGTGEVKRTWPWASLGLTRPAAALAAVFVAVGVGTIIAETRGGGSAGFVSVASPAVAIVPEPLAGLAAQSRRSQPARDRGARHGASPSSPKRNEGKEASEAVLTTSELPPAAPAPEASPGSDRRSRSRRRPRSHAGASSRRAARPEARTQPEAWAHLVPAAPCRLPATPRQRGGGG